MFGPTVAAWTSFTAVAYAAFEALNPHVLFAPGWSLFGRLISIPEGALSGAFGGAILGAILGVCAGGIRAILARNDSGSNTGAEHWGTRKRLLVALSIGVALGGIWILGSGAPEELAASNAACDAAASEMTQAGQLAHSHSFDAALAATSKALDTNEACTDTSQRNVNSAGIYFFRMVADYQTGRPFTADARNARDAAAECVAIYGRTDSKDQLGQQCALFLESSRRYLAQHYCAESLQLSTAGSAEIGRKRYAAAIQDGNAAIADAGKCKNSYAYAYQGMGQLIRGAALYLTGNSVDGRADILSADALTRRCVNALTNTTNDADLLKACQEGAEASAAWRLTLEKVDR